MTLKITLYQNYLSFIKIFFVERDGIFFQIE